MTVRASIYENRKGNIGLSVAFSKEEALELARIKGDGVLGEVAKELRAAIKRGPRKKAEAEEE